MILALVLHLSPGMVKPAHAQGSRKDDIVFNSRGVPLAGASVHVCNMPATGMPCSPTAQIYSDPLLTQALANPTTTDGMGNYFFYAAPGQYEIEISGPNITTKQIPNVILPSDPSAPTFNSLSTTGGISAFTLNLAGNLTVNGSTSVVGNLASGTLTLTNQSSPPGAASPGTVNLYTNTANKRLYYIDDTGTVVGPIATANGAQTNVANNWTAPQNIDADFHTQGPNPAWDVSLFGGYIGPNYNNPTTGTISSGTNSLAVTSALDFAVAQGILVLKAGAAPVIATPQAPTVTPVAQTGSTSLSYCIADTDWYGGRTPCSPAGSTATGVAAFGLQTYSVSGWSSTNGLVTITTSAAHNIPTAKYNGQLYPQVEIQSGSSNSRYCEGAFTLVAVPSSTTIQITRYGTPDATMNACSGGTLRVLPRVAVVWDSHYSYSVTNAACSGSTATLTLSPGINGPNGAWVVPWFVKAVIAGVSDSHYNTTALISNFAGSNISYSIPGGSCSGVNTGNLGGTLSAVPGKAVKNHLIYRCAGASCALPANAANYALVGVSEGNDGYFMDMGNAPGATAIDLGDASATAPTAATNDYLSTTISSISGTTFTLAANATNTVSGAKVFHDNTPNLLATCAAMPSASGIYNGGHIIIPTSATGPVTSGSQLFPIMANLDTHTCPGNTTFDFRSSLWLDGAILVGKGINFISDQGSANCQPPFFSAGSAMQCAWGFSYPMLYFEPEQSSNNFFQNLLFQPNQPYQSAFFYDQQLNDDGVVSERYDNVHVTGSAGALPIVDKGGFGRFWNFGGWTAAGGNFATQRTYTFTQNCGMPTYLVLPSSFGTYTTETHNTYNFGTVTADACGLATGPFGNATFTGMLSENMYGPVFLFSTAPYGLTQLTFNGVGYSDSVGGQATPLFDMTNSGTLGVRFQDTACGSGFQSLMETGTGSNAGLSVSLALNSGCSFIGAQNYRYDNFGANLSVQSGFNSELLGSAQLFAPMAQPGNFQSLTQQGAGNVGVGTYTFCLTASDALGGETAPTSGQCSQITVTGQASIIQFQLPATFPPGATGLNVYINNSLAEANGCVKPQYTNPGGIYTYNYGYNCGGGAPSATTAAALSVNSGNSVLYGNLETTAEKTATQCLSSASPAVCGANIDGFVAIPAGSSSIVVDDSMVTSKSNISLTFDSTQGSNLGVTCNTTAQPPYISARTAGTSFTISVPGNFTTNPGCIGFHIKN